MPNGKITRWNNNGYTYIGDSNNNLSQIANYSDIQNISNQLLKKYIYTGTFAVPTDFDTYTNVPVQNISTRILEGFTITAYPDVGSCSAQFIWGDSMLCTAAAGITTKVFSSVYENFCLYNIYAGSFSYTNTTQATLKFKRGASYSDAFNVNITYVAYYI